MTATKGNQAEDADMGILGRPTGLFDLHSSDSCVDSMLSKHDVIEILGVTESDLQNVPFKKWNNIDAVDEREIQKLWYSNSIPNSPPSRSGNAKISFDEMILVKLIQIAYPNALVQQQVSWGRKRADLRVTVDGVAKVIEYHGPSHFAASQYNPNPEHPSIGKAKLEDHFGIECVIWPYWIQRCVSNVRVIFSNKENGLGVLWSTNIHFGTFVFSDSAHIIEGINDRFRAWRDGGCGYFYGPDTENRNNPEHPTIDQIRKNKKPIDLLLPRGHDSVDRWVPRCLVRARKRLIVTLSCSV